MHILTSGPGFPMKYGKGGWANILTGVVLIKADWRQAFGTKRGMNGSERVRRPTVGSRIHLLQFEQNDDILVAVGKIYAWEVVARDSRARVEDIQVLPEPDTHVARIMIPFVEIQTGLPDIFEYLIDRKTE